MSLKIIDQDNSRISRAGGWDPSPWKTGPHVSYIVNIVTADDLATQGARASVAMVLTYFSWNIPVSTPEGLIFFKFLTFTVYMQVQFCVQVATPMEASFP